MPCTFLHFFRFSFQEKRVLQFLVFALLDKWNVNNALEKVKVYLSIVFYNEDSIVQYKRKET